MIFCLRSAHSFPSLMGMFVKCEYDIRGLTIHRIEQLSLFGEVPRHRFGDGDHDKGRDDVTRHAGLDVVNQL